MLLPLLLSALTAIPQPRAAEFPSVPHLNPAGFVQAEGDKPDKRQEIKDLLSQFKEYVKKRGKEDDEAVGVIDQFVKEFPESGPKDQKAIVAALEKCFKEKRKDLEDGSPDNRLFLAAAVSMGYMGELAAGPLAKLVDDKKHRHDLDLQGRIILSLGKTKSDKHVKVLLNTLKHHEPRMQAYAAEALAFYANKPLAMRKLVFEEILKVFMGVRGEIDTDTQSSNVIAQDRWATINGPMRKTLKALSGADIRDAHEWQTWWNKNKKKDWAKN